MKLKELKKGEFFTLKPIAEPTENQVFIKGDYDRSLKKYECQKFGNINSWKYLKSDTEIFTEFTF
jgi:hypothetical protein